VITQKAEEWAKKYREKLEKRFEVTDLCEKDLIYREAAKELCKRDINFFVNNFVWTYDPRPDRKPNHLPFILYDFQEEYLIDRNVCYDNNEDALIEKSRDMGVTWLNLAWHLHHWLFDETFASLLGSRKEDMVDERDNPAALFWKLEYMIDKLPVWLLPKGFNKEDHRKTMLIKNPENGNIISGESANPEFSRQGRFSVIDFDEYAFWQFAGSAWTAAGEAARTRFATSTPCGKNNKFADLRFNSSIKVISLHWQLHPLKTDEWYQSLKKRMTDREIAQEVDINYEVSGGEKWLPWYSAHQAEIDLDTNYIPSDEDAIYISLDQHARNASSCHYYAITPDEDIISFHEYYQPDSSVADIAAWMKAQPEWGKQERVTADPSLWSEDQEMKEGNVVSRAWLFENVHGIKLIPGLKGHDLDCRDKVRDLILSGKLKISVTCPKQRWEFGEALRWDDYSEQIGINKGLKETLKDRDNHSWDDFKYFISRNPRKKQPRKEEAKEPEETSIAYYKKRLKERTQSKGVGSYAREHAIA